MYSVWRLVVGSNLVVLNFHRKPAKFWSLIQGIEGCKMLFYSIYSCCIFEFVRQKVGNGSVLTLGSLYPAVCGIQREADLIFFCIFEDWFDLLEFFYVFYKRLLWRSGTCFWILFYFFLGESFLTMVTRQSTVLSFAA